MNNPDIKSLKEQSKNLEAILRVGKFGLNENVYNEIDKLLKKRKLIKIKVLNNCPEDIDEIINSVLEKSKSDLISRIGNVFVLYRDSSDIKKRNK